MLDAHPAFIALAVMLGAGALTWLLSVIKHDVSIVDSLWPLLFVLGALAYAVDGGRHGGSGRAALAGALLAIWALRLCIHITWRNWGEEEDRRYQAIRARNQPGFAWKSLYLVFALQAVLAWIIAMPVFATIGSRAPIGVVDCLGVAVWLVGFGFESAGDWQLARFKADTANRGRVLDNGLWHYSRHPNYFGEATQWWGFYLLAAAGGAWWTLFAPLLMTFLLLKVSGVSLLEKDIGERRRGYRDYVARTSVFVPWPPKARAPHAGDPA